MINISVLSKDFIRVPVSAEEDGLAVDPTGDVVEMAIVTASTDPVGGDWNTAAWETAGSIYYARLLVGPGSSFGALSAKTYDVWVKVTDSPEIPAMRAGPLQVW